MRAPERLTIIQQEPPIRQIQRRHRNRHLFPERLAKREIARSVPFQMRARPVTKSRAVIQIPARGNPPWEDEVKSRVKRVPLIVVQLKIPAGRRREIRQPPADRARPFGVRISIRQINFAAPRNLRRANGSFPPI